MLTLYDAPKLKKFNQFNMVVFKKKVLFLPSDFKPYKLKTL